MTFIALVVGALALRTPPPRATCDTAAPPAAISRRQCLALSAAVAAAGLRAPLAALAGGGLLEAATSADPLVTRLQQARGGIGGIPAQVRGGDWDAVRKAVGFVLPFLSFKGAPASRAAARARPSARVSVCAHTQTPKRPNAYHARTARPWPAGYTGASVKSRAAELGEEARAAVIAQRQTLLVALATIDRAAYNLQMGKDKPDDAAAIIAANIDDALAALDGIIAKVAQ